MSLFLGYRSAYEYWCFYSKSTNTAVPKTKSTNPNAFFKSSPKTNEIQDLLKRYPFISPPIHLLVANEKLKRNIQNAICHKVGTSFIPKSFIKLSSNLYISSPEACFLQLASEKTFEEILLLGFELCGTYAGELLDQLSYDCAQRTSWKLLSSYIDKTHNSHGKHKASLALPHVCDKSASPMESKLTLLLCLPPKYGGYGLPKPQMNYPIYDNEKELYRCDLCWLNEKLAIEYDSHLFHSSREKQSLDSRRRIAIEQHDFHVISVTKQQVYNLQAFSEFANVIARYLKRKIRIRYKDFNVRQQKLRANLLFK